MTSTDFIIRMRYPNQPWFIYSFQKGRPGGEFVWSSAPKDDEVVQLDLASARKKVQQDIEKVTVKIHYQIRPFESDSTDPRIEDYESLKEYDWSVPYPAESNFDDVNPVPEILIVISGGVIQEVKTTLPRLMVTEIDHDQVEIGERAVVIYELPIKQCNETQDSFRQEANDTVEMYQRGDDDEAYEMDEPYDWQL